MRHDAAVPSFISLLHYAKKTKISGNRLAVQRILIIVKNASFEAIFIDVFD